MILHVVECPRCFKARWHATGAIRENRFGLPRAECVCESCNYTFTSPRPEALEAAKAARAAIGEPAPVVTANAQRVPPIAPKLPFTSAGALAADFKKRTRGEGDGA